LLKRVFDIDLEDCPQCGGDFKIIAAIEEPAVIVRILKPIALRNAADDPARLPARAKRSDSVEVKRFEPMKGSNSHREWKVPSPPRD
jgi:hypothetical protein